MGPFMIAPWDVFDLDHMAYVLALFFDRVPERVRWLKVEIVIMCDVRRSTVVSGDDNGVTDLVAASPFTLLLPSNRWHVIKTEALKSFQVRGRGRIHQAHEEEIGCETRKCMEPPE